MSRCEVCGGRDFRREEVEVGFHVDGRYVLVEHLLATVCVQCGEKTFDPEAGEAIRRRLHPVRLQGDKGGFRASFAEARGRKLAWFPAGLERRRRRRQRPAFGLRLASKKPQSSLFVLQAPGSKPWRQAFFPQAQGAESRWRGFLLPSPSAELRRAQPMGWRVQRNALAVAPIALRAECGSLRWQAFLLRFTAPGLAREALCSAAGVIRLAPWPFFLCRCSGEACTPSAAPGACSVALGAKRAAQVAGASLFLSRSMK